MGLFKDIKNLLLGMKITSKHLGRHAVTIQYPEEKWEMPERSRGIVVLLSDKKTGDLNCTSCMLCMRACPTAAITIDAPRGEDKKRVLKKFEIDFGLCCFCGLCEEACNFCAIKLAPKYEFSTESKPDLTWDVKKLQECGRDVDYVDTRKKKKPKPAVKPKPAEESKPAAETKPTVDAKPAEDTRPATEAQPAANPAPTDEAKIADEAKQADPPKDKPGQEESNG